MIKRLLKRNKEIIKKKLSHETFNQLSVKYYIMEIALFF